MLVRDIGARGADALPVTVAADGEVSVGPEPIGHLAGFEFRVDPSARLADKRLLLAAAERRLGEELDRRARALVEADDDSLPADRRGWRRPCRRLGRPCPRPPRARALAARTGAPHRARARPAVGADPRRAARAARTLARRADRPPLAAAQEARRRRDRSRKLARRPRARRNARRCRRACFRARRRSAPSPISNRPTARRCTGCAFASVRSTSSCRCCSSPPPSTGARRCSRSATVSRCRRCPAPGAATLTAEADPRGAALAYRRLGRRLDPHRPCRPPRKPRPQGPLGGRRGPGRPASSRRRSASATRPCPA